MKSSVTYNFEGATCVVTGAGRGLGLVTAREFVKAEAKVVYLSRTPYEELLSEVQGYGERALFLQVDVSQPTEVYPAFERIYGHFGSVDILINNAGIAKSGGIEEISPSSWDEVMAINLRSYFLCTQAVLPYMKRQRYGRIVNVSSIAGRDKSLILGSSYTASKAAIIGLTRQVAAEMASFGINVNCVCPSQHRTPMLERVLTSEMEAMLVQKIPLGYIARPEQIAAVILFLASDSASYMTGAIVDVNGGLL